MVIADAMKLRMLVKIAGVDIFRKSVSMAEVAGAGSLGQNIFFSDSPSPLSLRFGSINGSSLPPNSIYSVLRVSVTKLGKPWRLPIPFPSRVKVKSVFVFTNPDPNLPRALVMNCFNVTSSYSSK